MHPFRSCRQVERVNIESRVFHGRQVIAGRAEGPALVTQERISFFGGVDPATGEVTERGHPLEGVSLAGKILVYPGGKGSTGATYTLYDMATRNTAPVAIISPEADSVTVVGAVLGKITSVDRIQPEFFETVQSGEWIEIDGYNGTVRVSSRKGD